MNTQFWFFLSCFFIVLEIGHPGLLYFLALAGGSMVAFGASWYGYPVAIQNTAFFISSLIAIGLVSMLVRYVAVPDTKYHKSNVDLLVGKIVTVTEVQSATVGLAKLGGEIWLVKLQGEGELFVGAKAIVVGVQGCHLQIKISA